MVEPSSVVVDAVGVVVAGSGPLPLVLGVGEVEPSPLEDAELDPGEGAVDPVAGCDPSVPVVEPSSDSSAHPSARTHTARNEHRRLPIVTSESVSRHDPEG